MINLLIAYLIVVAVVLLLGGVIWLLSIDEGERRTGSRLLFLALVWPVLVVPAIRVLWADTGWGKGGR